MNSPVLNSAIVVLIAFASAWITAPASFAAKPESKVQALHLEQTHEYFGHTNVWLSSSGFKFQSDTKQNFSVVATGPTWDVYAFRTDDKKYVKQPLNSYIQTGLISGMLVKFRPEYDLKRQVPIKMHRFGFDTTLLALGRSRLEFMQLPATIATGDKLKSLFYASNKMPTNGGITITYILPPIKRDVLEQINLSKADRQMLTTQKIEWVDVSPQIFQCPKDFVAGKYIGEITSSSSGRADSNELKNLMIEETGAR